MCVRLLCHLCVRAGLAAATALLCAGRPCHCHIRRHCHADQCGARAGLHGPSAAQVCAECNGPAACQEPSARRPGLHTHGPAPAPAAPAPARRCAPPWKGLPPLIERHRLTLLLQVAAFIGHCLLHVPAADTLVPCALLCGAQVAKQPRMPCLAASWSMVMTTDECVLKCCPLHRRPKFGCCPPLHLCLQDAVLPNAPSSIKALTCNQCLLST